MTQTSKYSGMLAIAKDKSFWKSLLTMVIPITIQNFFSTAVNSADVVMLNLVGQNELSAASLANQFAFLILGLLFGLTSGITIMAAQYWGKSDTDSIQIITGIAIKTISAATLLVSLLCLFVPHILMQIYTNDPILIEVGSKYLRIVAISYFFWGISACYECMLRTVERAMASTVISSSALILNLCLNAVFIFGLLGMPKLGIIGVGLATSISRAIELILCFLDALRGKPFKMNPKFLFIHHRILFRDFVKYVSPAVLNDISWTIAFSTYSIIMGHLSSDVVAANAVASTVRNLFTVFAFALSAGASVLVGIEIGRNDMKKAKDTADFFMVFTLLTSIVTGLLLLFSRSFVASFFSLSETAMGYLDIMLMISSYYIVGQIINTLIIAGLLRCGGNTRWGMICDTIDMWCVSVPLGFLCAFALKLPPMWVYAILCLDEFWKMPWVIKKYRSYDWIVNITKNFD